MTSGESHILIGKWAEGIIIMSYERVRTIKIHNFKDFYLYYYDKSFFWCWGCYPYIKYHCTRRPYQDLTFEDLFFRAIKVFNLGKSEYKLICVRMTFEKAESVW